MTAEESRPAEVVPITLELRKPVDLGEGTVELTDMVVEEIAASPDDPESYPSGSGVVVTVVLRGTALSLSQLSAGYTSTTSKWADEYRVTLLKAKSGRAPTATIQLERASTTSPTKSRSIRVNRGAVASLGGQQRMRFVAHGHKRTHAGQASPLILHLEFFQSAAEDGSGTVSDREEFSRNLFTAESKMFTWRNWQFVLEDHAYDEWMQLTVTELPLVPVRPVAP